MTSLRSCFILLLALIAAACGRHKVEASILVPEHEANVCDVHYREDLGGAGGPNSTRTSEQQFGPSRGAAGASTAYGLEDIIENWICPTEPYISVMTIWPQALIYAHNSGSGLSQPIYEVKEVFSWVQIRNFVKNNNLDPNKPTLIFTGGWTQDHNVRWLAQARKNFDQLSQVLGGESPANFLIFNWKDYSTYPLYPAAVAAVEHLAKLLSGFIGELVVSHNFKTSNIQIISHSLSAHIAGLTGRKLQNNSLGQLDQITAIDPTGICFHTGDKDFGQLYGLKPTDARLVLATHFNMEGFGAKRPIGGVDVFVNGGRDQPAMCRSSILTLSPMERLVMVLRIRNVRDHLVSTDMESNDPMPQECHEVAYHCQSKEKFLMGQCGSCGPEGKACLMLGVLDNLYLGRRPSETDYLPRTRMFITTGYFKYCIHHYQVIARLRPDVSDQVLANFEQGDVILFVDHHVHLQPRYKLDQPVEQGHLFTELLRLNKNEIKFQRQVKVAIPEVMEFITSLEINYMSNIFAEGRANKSAHYCPHRQKAIMFLC